MRLLLLSDSPVLVDALEAELAARLPAPRVIGKCYTLQEGMRAVQALQPDVVLLDGDMEGSVAAPDIQYLGDFKLVVLTSEEEAVRRWSRLGVLVLRNPFEWEAFAATVR